MDWRTFESRARQQVVILKYIEPSSCAHARHGGRDRVQNGHVMEGAQPNAQNEMGTWLQVCARPLILDGTAWSRWRWKRQHQIRLCGLHGRAVGTTSTLVGKHNIYATNCWGIRAGSRWRGALPHKCEYVLLRCAMHLLVQRFRAHASHPRSVAIPAKCEGGEFQRATPRVGALPPCFEHRSCAETT